MVAISVPNVDASVEWYRDKLGFRLASRNEYAEYGMTIAIMEHGALRIELVEVRDSASPATLVPNYANPASLQGIGKLAVYVNNLREWETRLREREVSFQIGPTENVQDRSTSFIVLDNNGNWLQFTEKWAG